MNLLVQRQKSIITFKNRLGGELHDFKIFVSLPNHRKQPTAQTADPMASILSQSKGYFHLHEPLLFRK